MTSFLGPIPKKFFLFMCLERLVEPENDTLVRLRLILDFYNVPDVFHFLIVSYMFICPSIVNVLSLQKRARRHT